MTKSEIISLLQASHDKHFNLLLKYYPDETKTTQFEPFGPPEMCTLAVEVHACVIALGLKAYNRLSYIGFDVLYPFDNVVDMHNWRTYIKNNKVDHTIYASIAIRIDAELNRMLRVFELGGNLEYESFPIEPFLMSKDRYSSLNKNNTINENQDLKMQNTSSHINIATINITNPVDVQAIEQIEKKSNILSNISNIINTIRTIFI